MSKNVLGIDVSKKKIDVYLMVGDKGFAKQFDNSPKGFKLLGGWLASLKADKVHACLEATGSYSEAVAQALHEAGHVVSVVNPFQIKSFGKSKLRRNKTDKADARLIAAFCRAEEPREWQPPTPQMLHLQGLTRRIAALEGMIRMERNRLEGRPSAEARKSINRVVKALGKEIEALRKELDDYIDNDPMLREQKKLLMSVPGVGSKSASFMLSEFDFARFQSARALAAFAGVTPAKSESGTTLSSTRLSKVGSARIRCRLYFPAIVAMRHNQIVKEFASRLAANGKSKMQIVCASMRKLLHIAYGVLSNNTPFAPNTAQFA